MNSAITDPLYCIIIFKHNGKYALHIQKKKKKHKNTLIMLSNW